MQQQSMTEQDIFGVGYNLYRWSNVEAPRFPSEEVDGSDSAYRVYVVNIKLSLWFLKQVLVYKIY